jgi:anti-sigma regulatory factor (Ser/Thr protein kinase)
MASVLKFEVLNSSFKGKTFHFKDGLTLGTAESCQIRAQHAELKPVHMKMFIEDDKSYVEIGQDDAHIYVNGKDVMRSELRHNDLVSVGPIKFKVIDEMMVSRTTLRLDSLFAQIEVSANEEILDFAKEDLFYRTTKEPSLRTCINFVIPSKDKFLDQAQVFLARLVKNSGAAEEQIDSFMTCAKELILNAHRHGHKYDETKKVTIRYRDTGTTLLLTIEDQGPGFDHLTVLGALLGKDAATSARERYQAGGFGGLGFQLITKLTSRLSYNDLGNIVTFAVNKVG